MADEVKVTGSTSGVGSAEYVAYLLMCSIAREKSSSSVSDYSMPVVGARDKDWILNTYEECLHLVTRGYRAPKST